MEVKALLAAVFAQVALTFALLVWLGRARAASAAKGEVRVKDVALSLDAWPDRIKQIANAAIHVTHNTVIQRFQVYVAGFAALAALWLYVAVRELAA